MDKEGLSEKTKEFIANTLAGGEKWLIEEVERMFKEATDEEDFLEEFELYLTRLEMKVKSLKETYLDAFNPR